MPESAMIPGLKTRTNGDVTVVELTGQLNLGNSLLTIEATLKSLLASGVRLVVVDICGLTYIDSAGIGMLVACNGQITKSGGGMAIAGAQGAVAKALEVVHMDRITRLEPDVDSACRKVAAP